MSESNEQERRKQIRELISESHRLSQDKQFRERAERKEEFSILIKELLKTNQTSEVAELLSRIRDWTAENNSGDIHSLLSQLVKLKPEDAEFRYLHYLFFDHSAFDNCVEALRLNPKEAKYHYGLANLSLYQKTIDQALEKYNEAIALSSREPKYYYSRGLAYGCEASREGYPAKAVADFSQAIDLDSGDLRYYYARGRFYGIQGHLEKAAADFSKVIDLNPNEAKFYNERGKIYVRQGRLDKAQADFSQAIQLNSEEAKFYRNRGHVYAKQDNTDDAKSDFTREIELAIDDYDKASAYNNRGDFYRELKKYDQAFEDYETATELDPEEPKYHSNRVLAFVQRAYSAQLEPAEIEKTFREREEEYRQRLKETNNTIFIRRFILSAWLFFGGAIIAALVLVALDIYFGVVFFKSAGESGMGFPYILVWASAVLTVLLSGLSYPLINALREAQRDKSRLEIAIEDYFRKGVLMRNVLIGTAEQKPALIAATHEHFANRSTAEFLAETPMPKESPGMLERMLRAARDQQDDTKTPPPPPSDGTPTPGS